MTIAGMRSKIQKVNPEAVATEAFQQVTDEFTEKNKEQLFAGFDKFGGRFKEYESSDYAFYKANKNPLPGLGNPDLYDTGSFYEGIKTQVEGLQVHIESSDEKNEGLTKKYRGVFGLGGQYKARFIAENLRPAFRKAIRKVIGL